MGWRWRQGSKRKSGLGLTEEEVFGQLEKSEDSCSLFLWRYSHQQMTHRLERAGILSRARELGYRSPVVSFGVEEGVHFLIMEEPGEKAPLMDLRLSEESRMVPDSLHSVLGSDPLSLLVVQWVSLQHVRGSFAPERPGLPGQSYPGLGLGRKLYRVLWRIARDLGKDAVSAYPMYYHNALYYSEGFSYLSPQKQGELLALERDLGHLPLKEASEGIQDGRLVNGRTGELMKWSPGEMFAAVNKRVKVYFAGSEYRDTARRVVSEQSYRIANL
jgi:hypothetical protein